jgi:hypothetical protein
MEKNGFHEALHRYVFPKAGFRYDGLLPLEEAVVAHLEDVTIGGEYLALRPSSRSSCYAQYHGFRELIGSLHEYGSDYADYADLAINAVFSRVGGRIWRDGVARKAWLKLLDKDVGLLLPDYALTGIRGLFARYHTLRPSKKERYIYGLINTILTNAGEERRWNAGSLQDEFDAEKPTEAANLGVSVTPI